MTGYSDDGGRSWTALAQLTDIVGSRPCAAGRCLTTAIWLCEVYGSACAGLAPPDRRAGVADAAAGDACVGPDCGGGGNGCGCALGGWPAASPVWLMAGLFLLAWRWRPGWARRRAALELRGRSRFGSGAYRHIAVTRGAWRRGYAAEA